MLRFEPGAAGSGNKYANYFATLPSYKFYYFLPRSSLLSSSRQFVVDTLSVSPKIVAVTLEPRCSSYDLLMKFFRARDARDEIS